LLLLFREESFIKPVELADECKWPIRVADCNGLMRRLTDRWRAKLPIHADPMADVGVGWVAWWRMEVVLPRQLLIFTDPKPFDWLK